MAWSFLPPHLSKSDLTVLLDSLPDAFLAVDGQGHLTYANQHALTLLGGAPFEPSLSLTSALPHLADTQLAGALTGAARDHVAGTFTEDVVPLGRTLEIRVFPQDSGAAALLRDVTAARQDTLRSARLLATTTRLAEVTEPNEAIDIILTEALPAVGAFGGSVYRLTADHRLTLLGLSGYDAGAADAFRELPLDANVMLSEVARARAPLFMTAAALRARYPHLLMRAGTVSAAALPLVSRGALLGVMGLSFDTDHVLDAHEREFLLVMAGQCALALDRASLYDALRDERDRLETVVRASTQLVWTVRPDRDATAPWWLDLTGQSPQDTVDGGWRNAVHPDDRARVWDVWLGANARPQAIRTEFRLRTARGEYRHFAAQALPRLKPDGTLLEWVGSFNDVTEQHHNEAMRTLWQQELARQVNDRTADLSQVNGALRAETDALSGFVALTEAIGAEADLTALARRAVETLTRAVPGSVAVYYTPGEERWVSVAWSGDFNEEEQAAIRRGLPASSELVRGITCAQAPLFASRWNEHPDVVARFARRFGTAAFVPVCAQGRVVGLLTTGLKSTSVWPERDEAVVRAIGRALTIAAERGVHAAQLEASNRELDAFTYSVSHDLRTPIRHIHGFAQLLRRKAAPKLDAGEARQLESILQAASRMDELVQDMLDLARLARRDLRLVPVDLGGLVTSVRAQLLPDELGRPVRWEMGALPAVRADEGLLRQVLVNLLGNALKYTRNREEARIEVWSEVRAGEVVVHVRDNGAGFDAAYADRLFRLFQRLHRESEYEGTGVGLANVKRIVERHGGSVWAHGQVDLGATFSFTLPLR